MYLLGLASRHNYRYNELKLTIIMPLVFRLINKKIANLISRFNVTPPMGEQFENYYPLEVTGDHYKFFL